MATPADPELLVFGLDKESANGSVEGLQRTWCDEQGRWPGDPACAAPAADQPRPGTFRA